MVVRIWWGRYTFGKIVPTEYILFLWICSNSHITPLTHWGRVTHICVSELPIIGSDNGLSPGRRQAIIWTNAGILLIGPLGTNFNDILIEIHKIHSRKSIWKCCLEMAAVLSRPQCVKEKMPLISNKVKKTIPNGNDIYFAYRTGVILHWNEGMIDICI